jgi:hypothetical protein|nr:hypothetical protein [Kofleriaceae bacterium]
MIEVGDKVMLVGVPTGLRDIRDLQTRTLFEACIGRAFVVTATDVEVAELCVGDVLGESGGTHTIWVERQYLRIAN